MGGDALADPVVALAGAAPGMMQAPLQYLTASGSRAAGTVGLTWFTLGISIIVCLIIGVLIWLSMDGALQPGAELNATRDLKVEQGSNGLRWITVGLVLTAFPLLAILVWTMAALAHVAGPPAHPGLTLYVSAKQWWWEATYNGASPSDRFTTANEIHIPVGVPVQVRLNGADVIHSFWVPQLAGKTDAIPGQRNVTWMQADAPGRYRGQCAESSPSRPPSSSAGASASCRPHRRR
jgi:cytochrome c oxidase subunit 2